MFSINKDTTHKLQQLQSGYLLRTVTEKTEGAQQLRRNIIDRAPPRLRDPHTTPPRLAECLEAIKKLLNSSPSNNHGTSNPPNDNCPPWDPSHLGALNHDQLAALHLALSSRDFCLIYGMPGSGKTHVLVHLVKCAVAVGMSVLVAAYTNAAVDNLGGRLV